MNITIRVPRINSNDDSATLVALKVGIGDPVSTGMVVAEIETDKSVVEIEAPASGFVIGIAGEPGKQVMVGAPLFWLGATPTAQMPVPADAVRASTASADRPPESAAAEASWRGPGAAAGRSAPVPGAQPAPQPSARARLRTRRLQTGNIMPMPAYTAPPGHAAPPVHAATPAHAAGVPTPAMPAVDGPGVVESAPPVAGVLRRLSAEQKAMIATVNWHREHAMAGYIETRYDVSGWSEFAEAFKTTHRLLLSPLLALMAWRLARLAADSPACNATLVAGQRYDYQVVNLGFTVQAGESLFLVCVRDADKRDANDFVATLGELTRRAMARKLAPDEMQGVTVGFSSMARWQMSRHVPVLAPHTALMVGHTIGRDGAGTLGAAYDHRLLNGAQVAMLLNRLASPG